MPRVSTNTPAPDFELVDYTGKTFRLSDYQNKKSIVLVLNRGFV